MLKKISWVIAALFVASAMIFIGCPTEMGKQDDGTAPRQAVDLVLEGDDIILKACGASSSKVVIDGTKVTLDGNNTGFYFDFPEEAATYGEVQVFFEIIEVMAGTGPGLLIKRNTSFNNPVGITSDQDPAYQLNNVGPKGTKFDTGVWKTNQFDNQMAFQNQIYNPANNADSKFTVEVLKILFPGGEPVEPPPPPPEYKGDATKIVYTKNATTNVETIVDSDPSITGSGVTISTAGVATFNGASNISYKFPTSAAGFTGDPKIEDDWDYVEIEFTIANGSGTGGEQVDLQILQYGTTTGYAQATSNDVTDDKGNYLNAIETGTLKIQTWGSGGKGGFTIKLNDWNLPTGGGKGKAYEKFDLQIKKITFTKGTRRTVNFYAAQANFNTSVVVLSGNSLGSSFPSVSVNGYTLFGWYTKWDKYGLVDLDLDTGIKTLRSKDTVAEANFADEIGTKVTSGTAITADTKLYAYWFSDVLPPIVFDPTPATGTLFTPAGNYVGADATLTKTVTYDGKEWWVVADATRNDAAAFTSTLAEGEALPEGLTAAALAAAHKGAFTTRLAFEIPEDAYVYDKVRVTYDTVYIGGDPGVVIRKDSGANSGNEVAEGSIDNRYPYLGGKSSTTNSTFVWPVAAFTTAGHGYLAMAKNNAGLLLVRITKIEFYFD
jgi:hypothetical protein